MRSRYSAYAVGDLDHVFRTWHPRTRPADLAPSPGLTWSGLEVLRTVDGGPSDDTGVVEFRARFRDVEGEHVMHETSRFERRGRRWVYVDGDVAPSSRRMRKVSRSARRSRAPGRSTPAPVGP